jgi:hypothetical protein
MVYIFNKVTDRRGFMSLKYILLIGSVLFGTALYANEKKVNEINIYLDSKTGM